MSIDLKNETSDSKPPIPIKKERSIELVIFLLLIVPSMLLSFFVVRQGQLQFSIVAISTIARDAGLLGLVLFLVWRNREPFKHIGWDSKQWGNEIVIGLLLFVPVFIGAAYLQQLLNELGLSSPSTPMPSFAAEKNIFEIVLGVMLVTVVAITEETMFRGYLIHRFENVTTNPVLAVIVSSFIFALGHGYQGGSGIITVGFIGLALAVIYEWRRNLIAPITIHFLQNFISIVIAPYLS